MSDEDGSCGPGLAATSAMPKQMAEVLAALAENLALHLPTLVVTDEGARTEHAAYSQLVEEYRAVAAQLGAVAARMAGYQGLPVAQHDEERFADPALRAAYVRYVDLQKQLLRWLETAVERGERMLEAWT